MRKGNTDVRYSFTSLVDSIMELFGGKISYQDMLNMDMPMLRSLVTSRRENSLKRKSPGDEYDRKIRELLR